MPIPIHFRTTQNIIVNSTVNSLHRNAGDVQRLQFQQATGKRINTPSDDPLGARRSLKFQNEDRRFEQFKRNLENTASSINETTVVLNEVVDQLMKAHDIAIRANNDVLNDEQRSEIANEIDQMLEAVFRISNTNREANSSSPARTKIRRPSRPSETTTARSSASISRATTRSARSTSASANRLPRTSAAASPSRTRAETSSSRCSICATTCAMAKA